MRMRDWNNNYGCGCGGNSYYNNRCQTQCYTQCCTPCNTNLAETFGALVPILASNNPPVSGENGFMIFVNGVFRRIDLTETAKALDPLLPDRDITPQAIQDISEDGVDIKFVFPPFTADPKKFSLAFDPTKTFNVVDTKITTALTNFETNRFPIIDKANMMDLLINKYKDGNCIVTPNSKGGFDINFDEATPVDIVDILTPHDTSGTPILFTQVEGNTKIDNGFNIPVLNRAVARSIVDTQSAQQESDLTLGLDEANNQVGYFLKIPPVSFFDNNDFSFKETTHTVWEGVPNWTVPNTYADGKVAVVANRLEALESELAPIIAKIDNELFPWKDSDTFTVAKVTEGTETYYQGTAYAADVTPVEMNAVIKQDDNITTSVVDNLLVIKPNWSIPLTYTDTSIVTLKHTIDTEIAPIIAKVDSEVFPWKASSTFRVDKVTDGGETYYEGTAYAADVTATEVNTIIKQDGNITTSVADNLLTIKPNWTVPNTYTDRVIGSLATTVNEKVIEFTKEIDEINEELALLSNDFSTSNQVRFDNLVIEDDYIGMHGDVAISTYLAFARTYNWSKDPQTAWQLLPPPETASEITKFFETRRFTSADIGKTITIGRTYYYLDIGHPTLGGLGIEPQGLLLVSEGIPAGSYVLARIIIRQNKVYGTFDYTDTTLPPAYRPVGGTTPYYEYPLGCALQITTAGQTTTVFSMKQYLDRESTSTLDNDCMYSEQIPVVDIRLNDSSWYMALPDEDPIHDILIFYDLVAWIPSLSFAALKNKTLFFSPFGSFRKFVDAIMTGGVVRDSSSTFKCRFNVADFDYIGTDGALSTCFDYELKHWNFSDGLLDAARYGGSVFVSPRNRMFIDVICRYDNTTKILKWIGGEYSVDDAEFTIKEAARFRDIWCGGLIGSQRSTISDHHFNTFNYITNTHSSIITRFNLENVSMDGYQNRYLLGIFKVILDVNDYDLRFRFGDIDLYNYHDKAVADDTSARLYATSLPDIGFIASIISTGEIEAVEVTCYFSHNLVLDPLPETIRYAWGTLSVIVNATLFDNPSYKNIHDTCDRIRIIYIDQTQFQTKQALDIQILTGDSNIVNYNVLARVSLDLAKKAPPYKVVLDWDASAPDKLELVDFTYNLL